MKQLTILLLLIAVSFAVFEQESPLKKEDGKNINGLLKATVIVYDSQTGGDLIWAGTTDGSLPSLRVENGYIHNIDDVIPSYLKSENLWIELRHDGAVLSPERIKYTAETAPLRRGMPGDTGEILESLDDELRIGNPGLDEELYVASARTGFGIDAPVERVEIDGVPGIKEGTAPTATTDFGKVYIWTVQTVISTTWTRAAQPQISSKQALAQAVHL